MGQAVCPSWWPSLTEDSQTKPERTRSVCTSSCIMLKRRRKTPVDNRQCNLAFLKATWLYTATRATTRHVLLFCQLDHVLSFKKTIRPRRHNSNVEEGRATSKNLTILNRCFMREIGRQLEQNGVAKKICQKYEGNAQSCKIA